MTETFNPPGGTPPPRDERTCENCGLVYTQLRSAERDDCPRCGVRAMADERTEGLGPRLVSQFRRPDETSG